MRNIKKLFMLCVTIVLLTGTTVVDCDVAANGGTNVIGIFGNNNGEYALLTIDYGNILRIEQQSNEYSTQYASFDNVYTVDRVDATACGNYIYIATESGEMAQTYMIETVASWPCGQQYVVYVPLVSGGQDE